MRKPNLLKHEDELVDRYLLIVQQYQDQSLLALIRHFLPSSIRNVEYDPPTKILPKTVRWFQRFMKWSYAEDLKRFNFIPTLLKTRVGRCGEWATLYTALLCSLGYRSRLILDFTDHVWTEVCMRGEWIHVDSTLDPKVGIDNPSYYKKVWKKKLTKILAFEPGRVTDVTEKYKK